MCPTADNEPNGNGHANGAANGHANGNGTNGDHADYQ